MRIIIQRCANASVTINDCVKAAINKGYLILLGIEESDTKDDANWLIHKAINLRIFDDEQGVMNKSIMEIGGEILVISQFTLFASYKKGNRPSWLRAAKHEISVPLYEYFCNELSNKLGRPVGTGEFGADMKVALVNDGPVTICMDSKAKEWGISHKPHHQKPHPYPWKDLEHKALSFKQLDKIQQWPFKKHSNP